MKVPALSRTELQRIYALLDRLNPLHMRPLTPDEAVDAAALKDRVRALVESGAGATQRGKKVLTWRLPKADAPTQNMIRGITFGNPYALTGIEKRLDRSLLALIDVTDGARVHGDRTKRWARITRFTSQPKKVDDPHAADAIGGKMPIDALVRCGVLAGDSEELCHRDADVRKTTPANTHLLVEVFELSDEEVPDPGPQDGPVVQRTKRRGPIAQAIADSGPPKPKRPRRGRPLSSLLTPPSGAT